MASGALESITINGRRFVCKSDDEANIKLSGFSNEEIVHGDGSISWKKTRHAGELSGFSVQIDDTRDDFEFLQEVADGLESVAVTATKVDGTVYSGSMQITEELEENAGENTCELTLVGTLEKM